MIGQPTIPWIESAGFFVTWRKSGGSVKSNVREFSGTTDPEVSLQPQTSRSVPLFSRPFRRNVFISTFSLGFTLVELLVAISIIALLVAILLPSLARARQTSLKSACGSNLHQLAIASRMCLGDSQDRFWKYYKTLSDGRLWWFGFERNGPGNGVNRPLDKSRGVLAPYLASTDDGLQCPAFPYGSGSFYPKFSRRSASYGYNLLLGPINGTPKSMNDFSDRAAQVVLFADGVHFDTNPGFNEGHYLQYMAGARQMSGYAHFRHLGQAQMLMLDGHIESQPLYSPQHQYTVVDGGPAGNLAAKDGSERIYGLIPQNQP